MKIIVLYLMKGLGFFYLGRRLIADKTLILAYHGFEVLDETRFRDQLFIKGDKFRQRLDYLKKHCNVIPLSELDNSGPGQVQGKKGKKNKVAITIDDGWRSTLDIAAPLLKQYDMPYTIYLTTENVLDNQPIFHIALDYILTRCVGKKLSYSDGKGFELDVTIATENIARIIEAFKPVKSQSNDTALLTDIAKVLQFDCEPLITSKALTLMSVAEVKNIRAQGADIQLHTHTHNTPLDSYDEFAQEIEVNREHIIDIVGETPEHHCYPSGVYNKKSFDFLQRLGVKTATTCYPGFCDDSTNRLELPRFLDAQNIPQIVFEAEVCGVSELLRKFRTLLPRRFHSTNSAAHI